MTAATSARTRTTVKEEGRSVENGNVRATNVNINVLGRGVVHHHHHHRTHRLVLRTTMSPISPLHLPSLACQHAAGTRLAHGVTDGC